MRALRPAVLVLGALAALVGLLWIGQGLGYVHWPASSGMLDRGEWADWGAILAVVGLALILAGRRLPRR